MAFMRAALTLFRSHPATVALAKAAANADGADGEGDQRSAQEAYLPEALSPHD
jgi:hypothetical protein